MAVLFWNNTYIPKRNTLSCILSNVPSKTERVSSCIPSNFHPSSIQILSIHPTSIQLPSVHPKWNRFHLLFIQQTWTIEAKTFIWRNRLHPSLHPTHSIQNLFTQGGTGFIQFSIQRIPSKNYPSEAEPVSSNSPSNAFHPKIVHPKRNRFHPTSIHELFFTIQPSIQAFFHPKWNRFKTLF